MLLGRMLAIATAALLSAAPVLAQSSSVPDTRIGLGIAFSNVGDDVFASTSPMPSIEVPIDVMSHLRVQPEFRYQRSETSTSVAGTVAGTTQSQSNDTTITTTRFGASILYTTRSDRIGIYAGGKVGSVRSTRRDELSITGLPATDRTTENSGYVVGPVIGGEYFLHDRFSLGLAVGIVYESLDSSIPTEPGIQRSANQRTLQRRASFTARVYLR